MKIDNEEKKQNNNDNELKSNRSNLKWLNKLKRNKNPTPKRLSQGKFNLDGVGEIEYAKLHRDANRPLRKIQEFDRNMKFCPCCSLPVEQKGYIERFNFCDNTDKFAECGRGISLYFSYFRLAIYISVLAFTFMGLPTIIITNHFSNELSKVCYQIYEMEKEKINETFPDCVNYINAKGISEFFINGEDWMLKFNSINIKQFRNVHSKLVNTYNNIDKLIINYSIIYFIGLIGLFGINLIYIVFLYNMNKQYDISVTSPSDYTLIVSNLYSAFHIFWKKLNKINNIIQQRKINGSESHLKMLEEQINPYELDNKEKKLKEELGLEDFPKNIEINTLKAFESFIKNKICVSNGEKFHVNQINVCYKISEFLKIEEKIQEKKSQIVKAIFDPKQLLKNEDLEYNEKKYFYSPLSLFGLDMFSCNLCTKSILLSKLEEEKNELENKLKELLIQTENLTEDNFAGIIFITFETMKEQEKFLDQFPKNFIMNLLITIKNLKYFLCGCLISKKKKKEFFLKKNIKVEVAPEPEDVIFENLQYSSFQRNLRIIFTYFLSFVIITICLAIILILNQVQIKKVKNSNSNITLIKYGLSLLISAVVSTVNLIFQICLDYITKIEKQISMTDLYLSLSIKLTIFTFITSAIVPLVSNYYIANEGDYDLLVANMATIFLSNSLITPIFWIFNFNYLIKKIQICWIEKQKKHNLTQRVLNSIYELPDMEISYKYSFIVRSLLMSFFYIPIFPLGILISFIGFVFGYFLEKYNFSTMYKRPEMLNSRICEFYSNYFILNFFMLGVGDYVFIKDNYKNKSWAICNILLFGILIFVPYNHIFAFDCLGVNESELKKENYDDMYFNFYNDYERSNPMTRKEGMKHFIKILKEKSLIKDEEFEEILKNIENINLMEIYYESKRTKRQVSIKKTYTLKTMKTMKTINSSRAEYLKELHNFVKDNKEFFLNLILNLEKKEPPKDKDKDNNEISVDKNNSQTLNQFEIDNTNNDINSKQTYNLATNRNMINNYKESEKIIVNSEKISAIKIKVKKKKKKIKKDDNYNKKNISGNDNNSNNPELIGESNNNKKDYISNGKSDNIYSRKNRRIKNRNIDSNNVLESCELNLKSNNNKYNDFTNGIKYKDNIEIYNRYKAVKNSNKLKKVFDNSITSGYDFKENYFPDTKTKNNIITNNYNNNTNEKNKKEEAYAEQKNLPVFSMENYNKIKQQILNQYKASPNPIFNSNEGIICDINMKKINDDHINKRYSHSKKMRFKRQKNRFSNYKRLVNNPSIEIYNLDDV